MDTMEPVNKKVPVPVPGTGTGTGKTEKNGI